MVFNIILNSSNVVNTNNTFYSKQFIEGSFNIPEGSEMCISQIVMPYSWFNITAGYNNNSFAYIWNGVPNCPIYNGSMTGTTFTGVADVCSSGSLIINQMVVGTGLTMGTYVTNTTGITLSTTYSVTAPTTIIGIPTFTGSISGTVLTLSSIITGAFVIGAVISGVGITANTYIVSLKSGTVGVVGSTYVVSNSQTVSVVKLGIIGTYNLVTFPDGFYQVSDINNYLQQYMITQNHYIYSTSLMQNQYFIYLYLNNTYYSNQFILPTIPSSYSSFLVSNSSNAYNMNALFPFSGLGNTPQIVILSTNTFSDYIGLTAGVYPTIAPIIESNVSSNYAPNGSTVNSIVVRSNLVNNYGSSPTDCLDTFYINSTFGSQIVYAPPYQKWVSINAGTYSNFYIYFQDQNLNDFVALDSNIMISLLINAGYGPPPTPLIDNTPIKVQVVNPLSFKE